MKRKAPKRKQEASHKKQKPNDELSELIEHVKNKFSAKEIREFCKTFEISTQKKKKDEYTTEFCKFLLRILSLPNDLKTKIFSFLEFDLTNTIGKKKI